MSHSEEYDIRLQKASELAASGVRVYPSAVQRTHTCAQIMDTFDAYEKAGETVTIVGRIKSIRRHGGSTFVVLEDGEGALQAFFKKDIVGESYHIIKDFIDMGDFLQSTGTLMRTKTGECTLLVSSFVLLAKALQPPPEQWHGLSDTEMRFRHREVDLIANPEVRRRFLIRSKFISALRRFLDEREFIEVETPILQAIPGGANARPFVTHHNALDVDFYLRIAPELYLKRLIVGGFEKVYEIGRLFRNEGIDHVHSPEFTAFELYWAFVPGRDFFISFLEEVMRYSIQTSIGSLQIEGEEGVLDFASSWPRMTFREAILEKAGIDIDCCKTEKDLIKAVKDRKLVIDFKNCIGIGEHYDQLFKKTAREAIQQPTWVFDYPLELKPLAKASDDDPTKSASAQLIVRGAEIINAYYHELNDPVDQRTRFMQQEALRERGSTEAQFLDEDYLFALEHGMPPTSGVGIGIDRLVALLTDSTNIKEVILFPTLRPK